MMATAIIVFREVLEAALIVGIVLAATRGILSRGWWIAAGIAAGVFGASLVAGFAEAIASAAEGMGQELFNPPNVGGWTSGLQVVAEGRILPGLGREFLPPLDEGSFLYMPSLLPHASLSQAVEVNSKQDLAIASAVGTPKRAAAERVGMTGVSAVTEAIFHSHPLRP